jgi:bacterioferritin
MEKEKLVALLNKDLADEHAATLRYLVHGWLEGEDTPLGASLLSRAREEMWHMHWLGMIIGQLGGEPNLIPAGYPYDPTSRTTIFKSYVEYEEKLIPHYNAEADAVENPHIKRVLQREAWESAIHARKFQRIVGKLSAEQAAGLPGGERELPQDFLDRLQKEVASKNREMLQHVRNAWVFQKDALIAWQLMDQAMGKMKQLAHFAEDVAENGITPTFEPGGIEKITALETALVKAREDVSAARQRHLALREDQESQKHAGLVTNLDLTLQQEDYESAELGDLAKAKS